MARGENLVGRRSRRGICVNPHGSDVCPSRVASDKPKRAKLLWHGEIGHPEAMSCSMTESEAKRIEGRQGRKVNGAESGLVRN
jgi:hypothetical protein